MRIDIEELRSSLVSSLHEDERRTALAPLDARQVGEGLSVPCDVAAFTARDVEHVERHDGVVRPGLRVPDGAGRGRRIGRICDVPDLDVPLVDSRGGEHRSVGRPPVTAEPSHLLRGDELRETPGDVGVGVLGERAIAALDVANVKRSVDDVRDALARRVEARVIDRARCRQLARDPLDQVRQEEPPGDDEDRALDRVVRRVRGHAGGALSRAFATSPFGFAQLFVVGLADGMWVEHALLFAGCDDR